MKCPICGGNAYLSTQDGITQPGRQMEVELRCNECGESRYDYAVGTIEIDLIVKRGSFKRDSD